MTNDELATKLEAMAASLLADVKNDKAKTSGERNFNPREKSRAFITRDYIVLSAPAVEMIDEKYSFGHVIRDGDAIIMKFDGVFSSDAVVFRKNPRGGLICSDQSLAQALPYDFDWTPRQYEVAREGENLIRLMEISKAERDEEKQREDGTLIVYGDKLFIPDALVDKVDGVGLDYCEVIVADTRLGIRFTAKSPVAIKIEETMDGIYVPIGRLGKKNGERIPAEVFGDTLVIDK